MSFYCVVSLLWVLFGLIFGNDIYREQDNDRLINEIETNKFSPLLEKKKDEDQFEQLLRAFRKKKHVSFPGLKAEEDESINSNRISDKTNDHFMQLREILGEIDKRFTEEAGASINDATPPQGYQKIESKYDKSQNSIDGNQIQREINENDVKKRFNFYLEQRDALKKLEKLLNDLTSVSKSPEKRGRQECLLWQGDKCVRMCRPSLWCSR